MYCYVLAPEIMSLLFLSCLLCVRIMKQLNAFYIFLSYFNITIPSFFARYIPQLVGLTEILNKYMYIFTVSFCHFMHCCVFCLCSKKDGKILSERTRCQRL
jgi:hypothetical protein